MTIVPLLERAVRVSLKAQGVKSRRLSSGGTEVHLYDAAGRGDLPTMVCLHGLGSSSAAFAGLLLRLRRGAWRVLAPDMPGHGLSGAPRSPFSLEHIWEAWSEVLLQELGEPAFLIGNSLGGGFALRFALEHPDRVRGIVLSSPAGAQMDESEFEALVATFRLTERREAMAFLGRLYHRPPWFGPILAGDVVKAFTSERFQQLVGSFAPDQQFKPEELARLELPILLFWGQSDRLMPRAALDYYRRHLPPHTRIEELEQAGHSPHVEMPDLIASRILEFARQVGKGAW